MKRNAFTLIELLVVIAIIAILAAILFPVFAAAKDSGKKTQSLSNIKQIATSSHMYSADYDDIAILGGSFITWDTWAYLLQPYTKTWSIFWSPVGGSRYTSAIGSGGDIWWWWESFAQYGYNINYMNKASGDCSDMGANSLFVGPPISLTSIADAANTVKFTEVGQDAPDDNVGTSFVWSPGGYTDPNSCTWTGNDWGKIRDSYYFGIWGNIDVTRMGFFRPRHAKGGVVAFADGHAKLMRAGALAAGTDWNYDTSVPGNIYIVDRAKYIFDIY